MAKQTLCDGGCGKVSPDARGLHIANKWYGVRVEQFRRMITTSAMQVVSDGQYCEDCYEPIRAVLVPRGP